MHKKVAVIASATALVLANCKTTNTATNSSEVQAEVQIDQSTGNALVTQSTIASQNLAALQQALASIQAIRPNAATPEIKAALQLSQQGVILTIDLIDPLREALYTLLEDITGDNQTLRRELVAELDSANLDQSVTCPLISLVGQNIGRDDNGRPPFPGRPGGPGQGGNNRPGQGGFNNGPGQDGNGPRRGNRINQRARHGWGNDNYTPNCPGLDNRFANNQDSILQEILVQVTAIDDSLIDLLRPGRRSDANAIQSLNTSVQTAVGKATAASGIAQQIVQTVSAWRFLPPRPKCEAQSRDRSVSLRTTLIGATTIQFAATRDPRNLPEEKMPIAICEIIDGAVEAGCGRPRADGLIRSGNMDFGARKIGGPSSTNDPQPTPFKNFTGLDRGRNYQVYLNFGDRGRQACIPFRTNDR